MSRAARATYDPLVEPVCDLCGVNDTKWHRLFECKALTATRQPFAPLLHWVREVCPHWAHSPFPTQHGSEDFLRLLWCSRRLTSPPDVGAILAGQQSAALQLYTDGSCTFPACPAARHTAWSVVMYNNNIDSAKLRALQSHPDTLQAAFPVLVQGLLPGEQSIFRAETAALVQVVLLADRYDCYTFQAWSDCSSALQCMQTWLDGMPRSAIAAPVGDLFQLLPDQRPANLQLHKVKAHQDFKGLNDQEFVAARGNWAADLTAKAAEKADLSCVPDYANEIAEWSQNQEANLFMFCQYLLEVTKAVADIRKRRQRTALSLTSAVEDGSGVEQQWLALQPRGASWCVDLPFSIGQPPRKQPLQWPDWFLLSLLEWGRLLQWPQTDQTHAYHHLSGITFLELMVNYIVCTKRLPPLRSTWQGLACYVDPLQAEGILQPVVVRELLVNFLAAIAALDKRIRGKLWPSQRHHRLHSLESYGETNGRKGLLDRPFLPHVEETGSVLGALLQNSCGETLRTYSLKQ